MRPDVHDAAYLWDMLDRANIIREFCANLKFHEYTRDKKVQLAVERLIEIIGEAANRVSDEFQQAHPEIPWRKIISQRNVLAH